MDENTLFVYNKWTDLGIETSFANYTVLLSFPDKNKPNSVCILNKIKRIIEFN